MFNVHLENLCRHGGDGFLRVPHNALRAPRDSKEGRGEGGAGHVSARVYTHEECHLQSQGRESALKITYLIRIFSKLFNNPYNLG